MKFNYLEKFIYFMIEVVYYKRDIEGNVFWVELMKFSFYAQPFISIISAKCRTPSYFIQLLLVTCCFSRLLKSNYSQILFLSDISILLFCYGNNIRCQQE